MVLDNLADQYAGQVAVVSIYTNGGSPPFYNSTAYQKITSYPPPYWWNGTWHFATPWLWVDGDKRPAYLTSTWSTHIAQRLQVSSDLNMHIFGELNPSTNSLELQIGLTNTGLTAISGKLHCVLIENGIQWSAPNGQQIHNHVPRVWWPDQNGMSITISPEYRKTAAVSLNLHSFWKVDSLSVVAYLQSNTMQPDSTIEIFQGASVTVTDIPTGIADHRIE
ncbi:Omp28-related outer membrane protein, partial [Candidatus Saccharibacteria bacterium]|nr:Omp28-related outer membrane protein [Candidatus Saccharibacteria bacterium]NIW79032.1 Omp28-related outer membrane protein [Calditrichia bacterium]